MGTAGEVHAFEPTEYAFERLKRNIALNPELPIHNIKLNYKGLASRKESKIEALESRFSSKLLAHDTNELIESITLDDYFYSLTINKVNFIKIDVDGYDYAVIKGGAEILKKYKPIVMAELCNRVLKERGVNVEMYLKLYLEYGYSTCQLLEANETVSLEELIKDPRIHIDCNILIY